MKQVFRAGAVLLTVGAVVMGTAGVASAKAKKVSPAKYAKTLCTTLDGVAEAQQSFVDAFTALDFSDRAALQQQAVGIANELVRALDAAEAKVKKTFPDVDNGKKVAKLFTSYLGDASGSIQEATETFGAADPNGVAFAADVSVFEVAFQTLEATLGDPFSKVTDQDLLGAFKDQTACDEIVTIIGG